MKGGTDPLKVCIVMGSHWSAVMGGAQYQAKCIVEQLIKNKDFKVVYLARIINQKYSPKGYSIIQIAENKGIKKYSYIFDYFRIKKLLRKIKPDVIYQRGLKAYTGILAHFSMRNGIKFIFHIAHDYDVTPDRRITMHPIFGLIEKKIGEYGIRNADYIIAQTEIQCELLRRNYGRSDVVLVRNFHPWPKEKIEKLESPIRVVWVANFKSMKRPELYVRLAHDLKELNNVEFIMIGRPGSKEKYKDLHKSISKAENINYLGEKELEEVNMVLLKSHIFVNTSVAEGFPNTFIQAWMRGMPVVSLSVNTDNILDKYGIGMVGKTYEGMRDAVRELIINVSVRKEMGEKAKKYALDNHTIKNVEKIVYLMKSNEKTIN